MKLVWLTVVLLLGSLTLTFCHGDHGAHGNHADEGIPDESYQNNEGNAAESRNENGEKDGFFLILMKTLVNQSGS